MDDAKDAAERRGVISRQCPKGAACGDVAADAGDECGDKGDYQQAQATAPCASGLQVQTREGKCWHCAQSGGEIMDGVEYCHHVGECSDEADNILCCHGLGNVSTRSRKGMIRSRVR